MNESTEIQLDRQKRIKFLITTLIVSFIVISGFGIRLINLSAPGFGTDEPLHVFAAKSIMENGKPELPSGELYNRALLYTKLVALSFKFFGVNEFAARLPSVIFGTLTIVLLFFIGKNYFGTRVGLISAFMVAFIPYQIAWSRECRMYTMFQFFFIAGVFAFYKGFENPVDNELKNPDSLTNKHSYFFRYFQSLQLNWIWIGFSVILLYISFSLQALTAIFGPSLIVYLVMMGAVVVLNNSWGGFFGSKYLFLISLIGVASFFSLLISPDVLHFAKAYLSFTPYWASRFKFNPLYYVTFLTSTHLFPLGAFLALGSVQVINRKNKTGFYILVCIAVPLFILTFIPSKVRGDRYIFNIIPLIILMASYSINNLFHLESARISELLSKHKMYKYKTFISTAILIIVFLFVSSPWVYYNYRTLFDYYGPDKNLAMGHRNWRQASNYIAKYSKPGDITIPSEPLTVHYYGGINIHYYIGNDYTDQRGFLVKDEKRISDIEDLKNVMSKNSRGWIIVNQGRFYSFRTPKKLREFIFNNLTYHDIANDRTVLVFSWDKRNISRLKAIHVIS